MALADDVKEYCSTDDDLSGYINAAEAYLSNAGIAKAESDALYALAVKMLVLTWYDNRTTGPSDKAATQPFGLSGIILQLQLSQGA